MNRLLQSFICAAVVSALAWPGTVRAEGETIGDFVYDITTFWGQPDTQAVIIGLREGFIPTGELTIPDKISYEGEEIYVVGLGYSSFSGHDGDEPVIGNQTGITSVRIPVAMRFIGRYEFLGCPNIEHYRVAEGNGEFRVQDNALCRKMYSSSDDRWELFRYPSGTKATIYSVPDNLINVAPTAFAANRYLKKLYIHGEQTLDTAWQLGNKSIESVDCSRSRYYSEGNTGEIYYGNYLKAVCPGRVYDTYTVSSDIRHVDSGAFCNATVRKVVIPENIESYTGFYTFMDSDIEELEILGKADWDIGINCFHGCRNLKSIELGVAATGLLDIGYLAFFGCESLTDISIHPDTKNINIGYSAFEGCSALTAFPVTSRMKITKFKSRVFYGCSSLESFLFGTLGEIDDAGYQFAYSGLKQVHWPSGFPDIPQGCFEGCADISKVNLKTTTEEIWYNAFAGSGLVALSLMGVDWYYSSSFRNCPNLMRLYFPENPGRDVRYNAVRFMTDNAEVIVNNPAIRNLANQSGEYAGLADLYVSSTSGIDMGDGWRKIHVPGGTHQLYSTLTSSEVVEMYSYDTIEGESAVMITPQEKAVRIKAVTIEGKEAVYSGGIYRVEGVETDPSRLNVTVSYTVNNNPMTSTYEYRYTGTDVLIADTSDRTSAEIYTLDGVRIADPASLEPGIYIVRKDNRVFKTFLQGQP